MSCPEVPSPGSKRLNGLFPSIIDQVIGATKVGSTSLEIGSSVEQLIGGISQSPSTLQGGWGSVSGRFLGRCQSPDQAFGFCCAIQQWPVGGARCTLPPRPPAMLFSAFLRRKRSISNPAWALWQCLITWRGTCNNYWYFCKHTC